ncbi:uncharacterized protein LOC129587984 [Paramacrobiotus metropolitanus]|uniref:uncharacterized protein LOC129587984 n=1 Tax=Paramacrobiotus metropolitanus TaxID=2943436 RepID=UPI002445B4F4|nr:uncharacterized protein LOC129587984 [Paramacrobiotus metropolitanus]XP_055337948.1 uncharacterized protein LOC129587984 [Paramacrobiotus metropolitanus]XP_055337949.1 uncharacterized protein LOC129587984 [Paramacrobiotus metropolitanus]
MAPPGGKHILVVNGPAYGHLMPLLLLSRKLAAHHHHSITFAVSRHKADQLAQAEFRAVTPDEGVRLLPIEDRLHEDLGHDDLVGAFHTMNHVITPAVEDFMKEVSAGAASGDSLIKLSNGETLRRPEVIIFDMFLTGPVMRHRLPGVRYYFFQSSPISLVRWFLLFTPDTRVVSPEEHQHFHEFPPAPGQPLAGQMAGAKEMFLQISRHLPEVDGIICNSFRAMEREEVGKMNRERPDMARVPVYCLGPFIPEDTSEADSKAEQWLATKEARSVVYVSFGSIDFMVPAAEQLSEIGKALVSLKKPVLWSLRAGNEAHLPPEVVKHPDMLILPWVPQKRVLAAPAMAVILSHSGWNGTLEALSHGVPIVSFPMLADQLLIGTAIEEAGVGVRLRGTGYKPQRLLPADEIAGALREVGEFEEKGAGKFHQRAQEVREQIKEAMTESGTSSVELAELVKSFDK